jgi:hypothetical protein
MTTIASSAYSPAFLHRLSTEGDPPNYLVPVIWDFLFMFINLNVIVTCFCVGGIPAVRLEFDVVETELLWNPSKSGSVLLTSAFLTTL